MTRIVVPSLVLSIFILLSASAHTPAFAQRSDARSCAQDAMPVSAESFINIRVDDVVRPVVQALLATSESFRRQWDVIVAARLVRVTVVSRAVMPDAGSARARTEITRYEYGAIRATIEVPIATDLTELLPHELEHVIEQLEGIDLRALAQRRDAGVVEVRKGIYETARARAAGLRVYREVYDRTDPAVAAAFGGFSRAWHAVSSRRGPESRAKSPAARPNGRPAVAVGPGAHLHKRW